MSKRSFDDTKSGLGSMTAGFLIYALSALVDGGMMYLWAGSPRGDPTSIFSTLIRFLALIFFLYGIYKIWKDAQNISYEHRTKVKWAIALVILGVIFQLISRITYLLTIPIYGIMPVLLVYELADAKAKKYLYLGASILIVLSLGALVLISSYTDPEFGEKISSTVIRIMALAIGFTSVGHLSFALGYSEVSKIVEEREKKSREFSAKIGYSKEIEESEKPEVSECPECGEKTLDVRSDGSAYCENCGYTDIDYLSND